MKVHHIGYLVKDIKQSEAQFLSLGFQVERLISFDAYRQVNIEFLVNGDYRVELVEPANQESPFYSLLRKFHNEPYHMCYEVRGGALQDEIKQMEKVGYVLMNEPQLAPCIAKGNQRVAFLMTPNAGIIELLEEEETN